MEIASKSQAENGTDNNTVMTPLRVKQAINSSGGSTPLPSNIAYTDRNNNFSTPQTVKSSVDVTPSSNYGFYKVGGVPIVQYNSNNHRTVVYGAPYDASVTDGAVYIRPDAVHGYGDVVVTPASTSVDKNLIVGGDTYEWGGHYIGNGNDLTLAPQGPVDNPPTNDTGDIVFNQWRDEGGGAYREIEKARIWVENSLNNTNYAPSYRAYKNDGTTIVAERKLRTSGIFQAKTTSGYQMTWTSAWSDQKVNFNIELMNTIGITLNNGDMTVPSGVNKVRLYARVCCNNNQLTGDKGLRVYVNGTLAVYLDYTNSNDLYHTLQGETYLTVNEGDVISVYLTSGAAGTMEIFHESSVMIELI